MKHQAAAGFSIVELMVALAVGLIIVAGVGQVFVSNKHAYRYIEGASAIQDQGNIALDYITQQVEMAGFIPNADNARFSASLRKTAAEATAYGANIFPLDGIEGGTTSDTLIVNLIPSGNLVDCSNQLAGTAFTGASGPGLQNRIEIKNGTSGPALFCNDVEIVPGIENMQVTYGLTVANPDGSLSTRYAKRDDPDLAKRNDMAQVNSVRIALLVSTTQEARPGENTSTEFKLLDTTVTTDVDRRMRKVFETTIRLRNRCVPVPGARATICT